MPQYKITITVTGTNIKRVQSACLQAFGRDISAHVEKIERGQSRGDRLMEAVKMLEDAKSIVEDLGGEMEEWFDNLPESLQGSSKGDALTEAKDALEETASKIEEAVDQANEVEFPGMFS